MNRTLASLAALALLAFAGCASPTSEEDATEASGDALTAAADAKIDEPAVSPTGEAPKVLDLSLPKDFDLSRDANGNPRIDVDVLNSTPSRDYQWVKSDRAQIPSALKGITSGFDVAGGKCRIKNLSAKKIVVGCKWTW